MFSTTHKKGAPFPTIWKVVNAQAEIEIEISFMSWLSSTKNIWSEQGLVLPAVFIKGAAFSFTFSLFIEKIISPVHGLYGTSFELAYDPETADGIFQNGLYDYITFITKLKEILSRSFTDILE